VADRSEIENAVRESVAFFVPNPSAVDSWISRRMLPSHLAVVGHAKKLEIPVERRAPEEKLSLFWLLNKHVPRCISIRHPEKGNITIARDIERVPFKDIFVENSSGDVCLFLDEHLSPAWVHGIKDVRLVARLRKELIERFDRHDEARAPVIEQGPGPGAKALRKERGRFRLVDSQAERGKKVRRCYPIPPEYGGRLTEVDRSRQSASGDGRIVLSNGTSLTVAPPAEKELAESVSADDRAFGQTHDRFLVALGAGWPECPLWFSTVNEALINKGIELSIHCTFDANQTMMSAMRSAYGRENERPEDDGIARYGLVIDVPEARTEPSRARELMARGIAGCCGRPRDRLMVLVDGKAAPRLWSTRWFRATACLWLAGLLLLACVASYFDIHSPGDCLAYLNMHRECHPIWRDLAWRRISPGDDLDDVVSVHPPSVADNRGDFTTVRYYEGCDPGEFALSFTGVAIIAKNGKLVYAVAWSCRWQHTFFDELSEDDEAEYERLQAFDAEALREERTTEEGKQ